MDRHRKLGKVAGDDKRFGWDGKGQRDAGAFRNPGGSLKEFAQIAENLNAAGKGGPKPLGKPGISGHPVAGAQDQIGVLIDRLQVFEAFGPLLFILLLGVLPQQGKR